MEVLLDEVIESRRDLIAPTVERVVAAIPLQSDDHQHEVRLVLTEAIANAVIHGNKEDSAKKVAVRATRDDDGSLEFIITDEGGGFDPARVPDPTLAENLHASSGRGVFLLQRLMDTEYRLGGRQVVLRKSYRPGAS